MTAPSLLALPFAGGAVLAVLIITALVPPACTLAAYGYWTLKDPDRLQSEDFVLQQRWTDTNPQIGDNRTNEVIDVPPSQSRLSANTASGEGR